MNLLAIRALNSCKKAQEASLVLQPTVRIINGRLDQLALDAESVFSCL